MKNDPDRYQIRISDLPGEIRAIAKLIGLAPALKLVVEYSGENVYFPKYDAITRVVRDKVIRDGFTGANFKELAKRFNLTPKRIRDIVKMAD